MTVTAQCAKISTILIEVNSIGTLGEWLEILNRIRSAEVVYYAPLNEFMRNIDNAINEITTRSTIKGENK